MSDTFDIAVNQKFVGKLAPGAFEWAEFNNTFENVTTTARGLAKQAGNAYIDARGQDAYDVLIEGMPEETTFMGFYSKLSRTLKGTPA